MVASDKDHAGNVKERDGAISQEEGAGGDAYLAENAVVRLVVVGEQGAGRGKPSLVDEAATRVY